MEPETKIEEKTGVDDESELDKEIEASLTSIKTGNEQVVKTTAEPEPKTEVKTEEKTVDTKVEDKGGEPVAPKATVDNKEEGYNFRVPNKGKFESDESYEKRVELMDLVKRRKLAKTDEQREQISAQIKTTKNELKSLNGSDKNINQLNEKLGQEVNNQKVEEDEVLKADQARLKELGGATKEEVQEMIEKDRRDAEVSNNLETFVKRHPEMNDADTREVFFDFVDQNYNWQNKSGKDLMTVLELARESMFKPEETIQERVLAGANVAEKVNAMQFPGGTIVKSGFSDERKAEIKEIMASGMSEDKAIELTSDD